MKRTRGVVEVCYASIFTDARIYFVKAIFDYFILLWMMYRRRLWFVIVDWCWYYVCGYSLLDYYCYFSCAYFIDRDSLIHFKRCRVLLKFYWIGIFLKSRYLVSVFKIEFSWILNRAARNALIIDFRIARNSSS
jgi:hypothetical protein